MNKGLSDASDFIKACVRPYIICFTWTIVCFMWLQEMEIPPILLGAASAIAGEYILERAVKRWKE